MPLKDNNDTGTDSSTDPEARPTDIFFLSVIPVPPTKFRPVSKCRVLIILCCCSIVMLCNSQGLILSRTVMLGIVSGVYVPI